MPIDTPGQCPESNLVWRLVDSIDLTSQVKELGAAGKQNIGNDKIVTGLSIVQKKHHFKKKNYIIDNNFFTFANFLLVLIYCIKNSM